MDLVTRGVHGQGSSYLCECAQIFGLVWQLFGINKLPITIFYD